MEIGDSFVSLHWEPPVSDGSCEVLHYIVERREVINQANIYSLTLADPRGGRQGRAPPLGVQILSFSCSFRQKIEK